MNIFEKASRKKFRFSTPAGSLSTEQLWDLPLTSKTGKPNLDDLARGIYADLKDAGVESFVPTSTATSGKTTLETMMEIVKHVIAAKVAANEALVASKNNLAEKEKIEEALREKRDGALKEMSELELEAKLADLNKKGAA